MQLLWNMRAVYVRSCLTRLTTSRQWMLRPYVFRVSRCTFYSLLNERYTLCFYCILKNENGISCYWNIVIEGDIENSLHHNLVFTKTYCYVLVYKIYLFVKLYSPGASLQLTEVTSMACFFKKHKCSVYWCYEYD